MSRPLPGLEISQLCLFSGLLSPHFSLWNPRGLYLGCFGFSSIMVSQLSSFFFFFSSLAFFIFLFFMLFPPHTELFQSSYHLWFFLLFGLLDVATLYCSFSFHSLNSSIPEYSHGSFLWCLYFDYVLFFWFHWLIFLFSYSWLSFLKTPILNSLLGKLWIAVSLITGRSLWTFGDVMFPCFFMFRCFHCFFCIWNCFHLL